MYANLGSSVSLNAQSGHGLEAGACDTTRLCVCVCVCVCVCRYGSKCQFEYAEWPRNRSWCVRHDSSVRVCVCVCVIVDLGATIILNMQSCLGIKLVRATRLVCTCMCMCVRVR